MKTSGQQTLPFGEDGLICSQEDSRVSHIAHKESDLGQPTLATCGRKCLEQFEKFVRVGLWQKTFADLLIGTGGWYSTRCKLTWKLQATKCSRFYFLLQVSELPIEETESGSSRSIVLTNGLTVLVDAEDYDWLNQWSWKFHHKGYAYRTERSNKEGRKWKTTLMHRLITNAAPEEVVDHINRSGLDNTRRNLRIVTRSVNQHNRDKPMGVSKPKGRNKWKAQIFIQNQRHYLGCYATKEEALLARVEAEKKFGVQVPKLLTGRGNKGFVPTPSASDNRDRGGPSTPAVQRRMQIGKQVGLTMMVDGPMNPRYVQELMGFPANWLTSPFQNGQKQV